MNVATFHSRNFLLHLQERAGYDVPVLLKELTRGKPKRRSFPTNLSLESRNMLLSLFCAAGEKCRGPLPVGIGNLNLDLFRLEQNRMRCTDEYTA